MLAFVINLDKDTDKWNDIQNNFKNIKTLNIQRFPAIYGKDIRNTGSVSKLCKIFCNDGIIGCYASHIKIMKKIIDDNIDKALIFEDDANPCTDFDNKWNNLQQYIPNDYDIVLLGHVGQTKKLVIFTPLNIIFNKRDTNGEKINDYIYNPYFPLGSYAYLISNKGCRNIIKSYEKINYHIDFYLFTKNLKIYSAVPMLVKTVTKDKSLDVSHDIKIPELYNIKYEGGQSLAWALHSCIIKYKGFNILIWHMCLLLLISILLSLYYKTYKFFAVYMMFIFTILFIMYLLNSK